jgi:cystathionine beta-lyase
MIISDEIHSDLVFEGHQHFPLPMISEELAMNCAVCMAPNKTFNIAGLASAFVVIPNKKLRVKYERWLNVIHIHSGNIFGNVAMEAAYTHGSDWVKQLMEYLEGNRHFLSDFISKKLPKVKMMQPEATFLAWLDFREYGLTEHKLVRILTDEAGVVMNKGSMFGTGGEGFFRINFGCPRATLEEALNRIAGTMEKYS